MSLETLLSKFSNPSLDDPLFCRKLKIGTQCINCEKVIENDEKYFLYEKQNVRCEPCHKSFNEFKNKTIRKNLDAVVNAKKNS